MARETGKRGVVIGCVCVGGGGGGGGGGVGVGGWLGGGGGGGEGGILCSLSLVLGKSTPVHSSRKSSQA